MALILIELFGLRQKKLKNFVSYRYNCSLITNFIQNNIQEPQRKVTNIHHDFYALKNS